MKYVELIKNSYPYKAGTQFLVEDEDDGRWSLNPFCAGTIQGDPFSCGQMSVKTISAEEFVGRVIKSPPMKYSKKATDDYMNPLNHP